MARGVPFRGRNVWHQPVGMLVFCVSACLFLAFLSFAFEPSDWAFIVLLCTAPGLASWIFVIRPRLVMLDEELVLVGVAWTWRYPLRDVVRAEPDGFGTTFWLVNGDTFNAATLARPNYAAWLKRRTRAHKVATVILFRAAELRGDPPPNQVDQSRGLGEIMIPWWMV
jgi:hypothetical protein